MGGIRNMFAKTVWMIHVLYCWMVGCCCVMNIDRGDHSMDSSKAGSSAVSILREIFQNKFLLLTVVLALGAAIYFCVGLFMLLNR